MATLDGYTGFSILVALLSPCWCSSGGTRESVGLGIQCGEVEVRINAKRRFFEDRRVPFKPEHLRLGANSAEQQDSCEPRNPVSESEMVISAGLQECGTESSVRNVVKMRALNKLNSQIGFCLCSFVQIESFYIDRGLAYNL